MNKVKIQLHEFEKPNEVDKGCEWATKLQGAPSRCQECPFCNLLGLTDCICELSTAHRKDLVKVIAIIEGIREVIESGNGTKDS